MPLGRHENQLELFDMTRQTSPRPHREVLRRFVFHFRSDQLILLGMGMLVGVTVLFACGVERGKRLVRGERALLEHQSLTTLARSSSVAEAPEPSTVTSSVPKPAKTATPEPSRHESKPDSKTENAPKVNRPAKPGAAKSRYAVQIVTFSQPQLAKRELDRLKAKGESAFLVMREGRTMVYVGPFSSKDRASAKVVNLKALYQDCFIRSL